jgi:hypothetical protein
MDDLTPDRITDSPPASPAPETAGGHWIALHRSNPLVLGACRGDFALVGRAPIWANGLDLVV